VIKERARAVIQTLPYQRMPKKMRIALLQNVIFWVNNIPKMGQDHSPRDLVCGEQVLNYKTVCRIPFGAYAQVHDDQNVTNTMASRTTGAISLGSTGNIQGTYRFMSLRTGDIIVRRTWTELPIPSEVIDRMTELYIIESDDVDYQHELYELEELGEESEENTNEPDEEQLEKDNTSREAMIERDSTHTRDGELQQGYEEENFDLNKENENTESEEVVQETVENETDSGPIMVEGDIDPDPIMEEENKEIQPQTNGHNLRHNRERNYSYRFTFLSVRVGLRRFGEKGKEAILDELKFFF
jgi:hypothetical protein